MSGAAISQAVRSAASFHAGRIAYWDYGAPASEALGFWLNGGAFPE